MCNMKSLFTFPHTGFPGHILDAVRRRNNDPSKCSAHTRSRRPPGPHKHWICMSNASNEKIKKMKWNVRRRKKWKFNSTPSNHVTTPTPPPTPLPPTKICVSSLMYVNMVWRIWCGSGSQSSNLLCVRERRTQKNSASTQKRIGMMRLVREREWKSALRNAKWCRASAAQRTYRATTSTREKSASRLMFPIHLLHKSIQRLLYVVMLVHNAHASCVCLCVCD